MAAARPASFAPTRQVDAGVLSVGYAEAGPIAGPAVIGADGVPRFDRSGMFRLVAGATRGRAAGAAP